MKKNFWQINSLKFLTQNFKMSSKFALFSGYQWFRRGSIATETASEL